MVLFRQLVVVYLVLIPVVSVKGETLNGKDDDRLHRSKRSVYPCASTNALKKYQYVSGHTACISASASADLAKSGVTASEQTEIVNQHNTYRGSTAATDMNMMSWDNEVAYIAQKWAENCQTNHDAGYKRRIPGRFALGQNLAWSGNKMTWTAAIKLWHDEITQFTYNGDSNVFSQVGHYTQVVWAKSIKIGCGYAKCGSTHLYVCNYGPPGNVNVKTPYTQGTKCSSCSGNCLNDLCNCDLVCLNGGTLNLAACTCSCISGYTGTDCALDCATKTDPSQCLASYTATRCPVSNVPDECPNMCSFCPNSGIAITGATNGKGVVPFDLAVSETGRASVLHGHILLQYTCIIISLITYIVRYHISLY